MDNLFDFAAACLHHADIETKLALTGQAWQLQQDGKLGFQRSAAPLPTTAARFPERPICLDPRAMPRRKLTSFAGLQAFFHAIAHIEFNAIYLAWDILYRFPDMPRQFYVDWLQVAEEEARHFAMIREHLRGMGCDYGDLPAHRGLWDLAEATAGDILARLALVPRYMEAHGLDVTPPMLEKFTAMGDTQSVAILTQILNDEVGHVAFGDRWFRHVCGERGVDPEASYRELLRQHMPGKPKRPLNRAMRLQAGFGEDELAWLESLCER